VPKPRICELVEDDVTLDGDGIMESSSPRVRRLVSDKQIVFTLLATLSTLKVCHSVRLLKDSVIPPHALKGHQAVLRCNYDMEGDDLYSVKWYYNQKEFYRFIPSDNPKVTIFNHHKGVKVNSRLSTEREVVLDNVDFRTTGEYRCEVSGDAPMFQTASISGILFVVDLPDRGPDISGGVPRYNIGDRVNVTCLSRNSMPAAQLAWYVNGEKADDVHLRTYPEETDRRTGLKTSRLGLTFKVRHNHFVNKGDLKLKCTATIFTVYWKSSEESVQGSGFNAHTAPVSESRGRTSAATSLVTGGSKDDLLYASNGGGYGLDSAVGGGGGGGYPDYSGSGFIPRSGATHLSSITAKLYILAWSIPVLMAIPAIPVLALLL